MSLNCTVHSFCWLSSLKLLRAASASTSSVPFQLPPLLVSPLLRLPIFTPSSWLILGNLCDHSPHTPGTWFLILCGPISALAITPYLQSSFSSPYFSLCSFPLAFPLYTLTSPVHTPTQLLCFSWQRDKMLLRCWPMWWDSSSSLSAMKAEGCSTIWKDVQRSVWRLWHLQTFLRNVLWWAWCIQLAESKVRCKTWITGFLCGASNERQSGHDYCTAKVQALICVHVNGHATVSKNWCTYANFASTERWKAFHSLQLIPSSFLFAFHWHEWNLASHRQHLSHLSDPKIHHQTEYSSLPHPIVYKLVTSDNTRLHHWLTQYLTYFQNSVFAGISTISLFLLLTVWCQYKSKHIFFFEHFWTFSLQNARLPHFPQKW